MNMKWIKLLILLLCTTGCGCQSLEFLSTGRVQPGDRLSVEQLTVFDGVPISHCDIRTKREQLKPVLASQSLSKNCDGACYEILHSLHEISSLIDSTLHVVQRWRGCIQSANGKVSAFEAWAVNGMDFLSFDPESQRWTAQSPSAITVRSLWNKKRAMNVAFRHFIREKCPLMIRTIQLRSKHQNTELRVFAKPINTHQALLGCHVISSDKSVSSVRLIGDGASRASWISVAGPLPSEDGSVILRLTAGISRSQNSNKYGCTVQTGGHNVTVFWDGYSLDGTYLLHSSVHRKMIIILGVGCVVFIIMIISYAMIFSG